MNNWSTIDEQLINDGWTIDEWLMNNWWKKRLIRGFRDGRMYAPTHRRTMLVVKSLLRLKNIKMRNNKDLLLDWEGRPYQLDEDPLTRIFNRSANLTCSKASFPLQRWKRHYLSSSTWAPFFWKWCSTCSYNYLIALFWTLLVL